MTLTTKVKYLGLITHYMKSKPTKQISAPKDWGFFERRIKYRKCLNEAYDKVGFSFPIGMAFFDNSLKEKNELWERRKRKMKWLMTKFVMPISIMIIGALVVNLII